MLKKILVILFLMCFNACFAAQIPVDKQAKYKTEIETYAATQAPKVLKEIDKEYRSINVDPYSAINNINGIELYFYIDLIDITDKYIKIKKEMPETDSPGDLYKFLLPYLEQYKIDKTNILKVYYFSDDKTKKILKYIDVN